MKKASGFTLVELLVVIAIIALLISILAPSLKVAKTLARELLCKTSHAGIAKAIHLYAAANKGSLLLHASSDTPRKGSFVRQKEPALTWEGAGILYSQGFFNDIKLAYCPMEADSRNTYEVYAQGKWEPPCPPNTPWDRWSGSFVIVPYARETYAYSPQRYTQLSQMHPETVLTLPQSQNHWRGKDWNLIVSHSGGDVDVVTQKDGAAMAAEWAVFMDLYSQLEIWMTAKNLDNPGEIRKYRTNK
jgi:prepilin-type N-terminal cleavage/methylation domain-containing protein